MCIMIGKLRGVAIPSEEVLDNCLRANRDGIGVAYTDGNGPVKIKKDFENIWTFKQWLKKNIGIEHAMIIHYRLATSGLVDAGNRHPFPLTQDKERLREVELECPVAVAHNGVFFGLGDETYSDTQNFINKIIGAPEIIAGLHTPAMQTLIMNYLDKRNKLIFLHEDATIWRYGEFEEAEGGLFFSNSGYKSYKTYNGSGYGPGRIWDANTCQWRDVGTNAVVVPSTNHLMLYQVNCSWCQTKHYETGMLEIELISDSAQKAMVCRRCYYKKDLRSIYKKVDRKKGGLIEEAINKIKEASEDAKRQLDEMTMGGES